MCAYYIMAIATIAIALLLAVAIGTELTSKSPDIGSLIGEIIFVAIAILWAVIAIRTISQSKIKTDEQPQIELKITTVIAPDGSTKSDTTYIYKFKKITNIKNNNNHGSGISKI